MDFKLWFSFFRKSRPTYENTVSSSLIITKTAGNVAAENVELLNLAAEYDLAGREFTILNKCALRNVPFDGNLTTKD
jgi:hypothetical protein